MSFSFLNGGKIISRVDWEWRHFKALALGHGRGDRWSVRDSPLLSSSLAGVPRVAASPDARNGCAPSHEPTGTPNK